uniref:Transporter n=1 Tax=Scolopendra viridis TaxID=118503 RepID=A0A4D5R9I8_SCOVI
MSNRKTSLENGEGIVEMSPLNNEENGTISIAVPVKEERAAWDSKIQFLMSIISYGVGLGNVWRFPYLCQQNGGGAFLIPYFIMLVLEGIPIFLLELGIGQRVRLGSIGVWNKIHPWIGGIGIGSTVISFFVGLYYNMIIAWCLYYFFSSFQPNLPWATCPLTDNGTKVEECALSSETAYFWYRNAVDISPSLNESGGLKWWMVLCLLAAWIITYLCMMKGIQSSGKVVYFTATFPYIVLIIFFGRAITLKGSDSGVIHMFTPKMERLADPTVWLDAATQVFYSLGLAFGSLISFSSYNPPKNDCKRDAVVVSIVNCMTSILSCLVVFAVLGFKATMNLDNCVDRNIEKLLHHDFSDHYTKENLTHEIYRELEKSFTNDTIYMYKIEPCELQEYLNQAAEGTGLAFIVFTQAIVEFPGAPFWSVIFFMMLLTLGLGSMFGTLEGVVGNVFDMNLVSRVRKEVVSGIICLISFFIGLIFCTGAGEYWVNVFDSCSGSMGLLLIAFFEVIGIVYIYGHEKFMDDIEDMVGDRPNLYWSFMWRFGSPIVMIVVFVSSIIYRVHHPPTYKAWDAKLGQTEEQYYPDWVAGVCSLLVLSSVLPILLVFLMRLFKCQKLEADIPVSIKRIGTTVSTTGMMENMDDGDYHDADPDPPIGDFDDSDIGCSTLQIPTRRA